MVGASSTAKTVSVSNNLSTTLTIGFIASGDYAAIDSGATPCGSSLAGKAKCTISVTFKPKSTGSINGAVTITYNSSFSPQEDHTHSSTGQYDGWLRKFTIAPQIGAGRQFFSRPVLRAFLTYVNWSDGLRGFVGGIPFQNRTNGLTYGVQAETWW
jgi:maltoporin